MSKIKDLFKSKKKKIGDRTNDKAIRTEIDRLLVTMETLDPRSDEYLACLARVEDLNRLLPKREKKSVDGNTILSVSATIGIALLALYQEEIKDRVIRAKVWNWIRPKF